MLTRRVSDRRPTSGCGKGRGRASLPRRAPCRSSAAVVFLLGSMLVGLLVGPVHIGARRRSSRSGALAPAAARHVALAPLGDRRRRSSGSCARRASCSGVLVGGMLALAGGVVPGRLPQPARRPVPARRRRRRRPRRDDRDRVRRRHRAARYDLLPLAAFLGAGARRRCCSYVARPLGRRRPQPGGARARRRHGRGVPHRRADVRPAAALRLAAGGLQLDPRPPRHRRLARRGARRCPTSSSARSSILLHRRLLDVLSVGDEEAATLGVQRPPRAAQIVVVATIGHGRRGRGQRADRLRRDHRPARDPARGRHELPDRAAALAALRRRLPRALRRDRADGRSSPAELPIGVVTAFFGAPFFAIVLRTSRSFT